MSTPTYQPHDPKAPYNERKTYYHTDAGSWFADVEYPNPAKPVEPAKVAKKRTLKKRQTKRVIRFRKMRPVERELVFWLFLLLLAKWFIFGL